MKELNLENDKPAIVDDEDHERVSKFKWYNRRGHIARRDYRYRRVQHWISLASEVLLLPYELIDHKDSNPFNNQKLNLRQADTIQNAANRSKMKYCSSKYKGVYWRTGRNKWGTGICIDGRSYNLGSFLLEEDAARAYDKKAKEAWGEFAKLNFPDSL